MQPQVPMPKTQEEDIHAPVTVAHVRQQLHAEEIDDKVAGQTVEEKVHVPVVKNVQNPVEAVVEVPVPQVMEKTIEVPKVRMAEPSMREFMQMALAVRARSPHPWGHDQSACRVWCLVDEDERGWPQDWLLTDVMALSAELGTKNLDVVSEEYCHRIKALQECETKEEFLAASFEVCKRFADLGMLSDGEVESWGTGPPAPGAPSCSAAG